MKVMVEMQLTRSNHYSVAAEYPKDVIIIQGE